MFYIQIIRHNWTKASRGGASAQARNALPQTISSQIQSSTDITENIIAIQEEFSWFEPFDNLKHGFQLIEPGKTTPFLKKENGIGLLQFEFSEQNCGAANRENLRKSIEIPASGWVQIIANGRFSDMDTGAWWYVQWIFNAIHLETGETIGNPFSRYPLVTSFDGRRHLR